MCTTKKKRDPLDTIQHVLFIRGKKRKRETLPSLPLMSNDSPVQAA